MPYAQIGMGTRPDLTMKVQEYVFSPDTFAAEEVFPAANAENKSGIVSVVTRESLLGVPRIERAPGGEYNKINLRLGAMPYACEDKGLEYQIFQGEQDPPGIDIEMTGASVLALQTRTAFELDFAGIAQDKETFSESDGNYAESAVAWSEKDDADPIDDIISACDRVRELTGIRPNALVLNSAQVSLLIGNAKVRAQFPGAAVVTYDVLRNALPALCGLERMIVSNAVGNTSKKPGTVDIAPIWNADYALVAVVPPAGAPLEVPALGRTIQWAQDSNGWVADAPYWSDATRCWTLRVRRNFQIKVIDPLFGCLIDVTHTGS